MTATDVNVFKDYQTPVLQRHLRIMYSNRESKGSKGMKYILESGECSYTK